MPALPQRTGQQHKRTSSDRPEPPRRTKSQKTGDGEVFTLEDIKRRIEGKKGEKVADKDELKALAELLENEDGTRKENQVLKELLKKAAQELPYNNPNRPLCERLAASFRNVTTYESYISLASGLSDLTDLRQSAADAVAAHCLVRVRHIRSYVRTDPAIVDDIAPAIKAERGELKTRLLEGDRNAFVELKDVRQMVDGLGLRVLAEKVSKPKKPPQSELRWTGARTCPKDIERAVKKVAETKSLTPQDFPPLQGFINRQDLDKLFDIILEPKESKAEFIGGGDAFQKVSRAVAFLKHLHKNFGKVDEILDSKRSNLTQEEKLVANLLKVFAANQAQNEKSYILRHRDAEKVISARKRELMNFPGDVSEELKAVEEIERTLGYLVSV